MENLLRDAKKGNHKAFLELMRLYGPKGYGYLIKISEHHNVDEAFINIWLKLYHDLPIKEEDFFYEYMILLLDFLEKFKTDIHGTSNYKMYENLQIANTFKVLSKEEQVLVAKSILGQDPIENTILEDLNLNVLQEMFLPVEYDRKLEKELAMFFPSKKHSLILGFVAVLMIVAVSFYLVRELKTGEVVPWTQENSLEEKLANEGFTVNIENETFSQDGFAFDLVPSTPLKKGDYDLVIKFPTISNREYSSEMDQDAFHFVCEPNNEFYLKRNIQMDYTLYTNDTEVFYGTTTLTLSQLTSKVLEYELNYTIHSEVIDFEFISLKVDGPLMTLKFKEKQLMSGQLWDYNIFLMDNEENFYDVTRYNYDGEYMYGEIDNTSFNPFASELTIYVKSIQFGAVEPIGVIENGKLEFEYENVNYHLEVLEEDGAESLHMTTDYPVSKELFSRLRTEIKHYWFDVVLEPDVLFYDLTRDDFNAVYDISGENVEDLNPILDYIYMSQEIQLNEDNLRNVIKWLPEYEQVSVLIDQTTRKEGHYRSYFDIYEGITIGFQKNIEPFLIDKFFTIKLNQNLKFQ
ncbi:MAG: hypothetical protein JXR88_04825 [Clostridia bacterium]|nr:hypothetical protein [Clostridia bacterium]